MWWTRCPHRSGLGCGAVDGRGSAAATRDLGRDLPGLSGPARRRQGFPGEVRNRCWQRLATATVNAWSGPARPRRSRGPPSRGSPIRASETPIVDVGVGGPGRYRKGRCGCGGRSPCRSPSRPIPSGLIEQRPPEVEEPTVGHVSGARGVRECLPAGAVTTARDRLPGLGHPSRNRVPPTRIRGTLDSHRMRSATDAGPGDGTAHPASARSATAWSTCPSARPWARSASSRSVGQTIAADPALRPPPPIDTRSIYQR